MELVTIIAYNKKFEPAFVCLCVSLSVRSYLKCCRRAPMSMGIIRTVKFYFNPPGSGNLTKELMWTFDVDYVTRNNSSS